MEQATAQPKVKREKCARVIGYKQFTQKRYTFLENLPEDILASFGFLTTTAWWIIWGNSGNGKTNFLVKVIKILMDYGKVLYVSLEEGTEATMLMTVMRNFNLEEHSGKIEFADHEMTYRELCKKLDKKKSPKVIVIDSLQYWGITYEQYKQLKERYKKKIFLFISHANGKNPDGKVANRIRYDVPVKVRVEGFVAFPEVSRFGGNNPFVIWPEGAQKYWGKEFKKKTERKFPIPNREDIEKLLMITEQQAA